MSNSTYAGRKLDNLDKARTLYYQHAEGLTDAGLALLLGVRRKTAYLYRVELGCTLVTYGRYTLIPDTDAIALAHAIIARAKLQRR